MQHHFANLGAKTLKAIIALFFTLSILFGAKLTFMHLALPMDFGSFMASGEQAWAGTNPYSYDHELVFNVPISDFQIKIPSPNLNPPISALLFQIISATGIDPGIAAIAWKIISFISYLIFLYYLRKAYPQNTKPLTILWTLSLAGFWQTVEVGQIYMPLLFIVFFAWRNLEKKNWIGAGFFIGLLIAIKPQFILWAVFLLITARIEVFISSAITSIIISAIPLVYYGINIYSQWIYAIRQYDGALLPGNMSIQSLSMHIGIPSASLWVTFALLVFMFAYLKLKKAGTMQTSYLSLLTTLLISPYSWSGYSLFLLPAFFSREEWSWKMKIASVLLAFPFAFVLEYFTKGLLNFIVFGWIYGWALVFLAWDGMTTVRNDLHLNQGRA